MTRLLKVLVLATVAALALSAIAAAGASAAEFTLYNSETKKNESGTLSGVETEVPYVFTITSGLTVSCEEAHFESTSSTGKQTELTITPSFGKCHSVIFGKEYNANVTVNGCDYRHDLTGSKEEKEEVTWEGTTDIICPEGKHIDLKVTEGEKTKCDATIGAQENLGKTTTHSQFRLVYIFQIWTTHNEVVNTSTEGGLLACGVTEGVHSDGKFEGTLEMEAFNTKSEHIDFINM